MSSFELDGERIRIIFPPRNVPIINAVAAERIEITLASGREPADSDIKMLNLDEAAPYLFVHDTQDLRLLAERFIAYAGDEERASTNIAMQFPPELAGVIHEDRAAKAKVALSIAESLSAELRIQEAIGPSLDVPPEWLLD